MSEAPSRHQYLDSAVLVVVILFLSLWPNHASAACGSVLKPGDNVASVVTNAAAGSTVCLDSGDYGSVNFIGINKSDYVTIQSSSGRGATISLGIAGSKFLRFTSLTVKGANITYSASNVQITNSTFTDGLTVNMRGASKANYPLNILIDGNIFSNLGQASWEGRISVGDDDGRQPSMGLVLSNNEIRDGCLSDGVQLVGGASGVQIGPGNVFSNILQSGPIHCDNIQFYGSGWHNDIIGNMFKNGSTLMLVDSDDEGVIRDNVFDNIYSIQIAQTKNTIFEHNTLKNSNLSINYGSVATIKNNIFVNSGYSTVGTIACSICTATYNLSSEIIAGDNNSQGIPSFVGGANPSTWAGFQLSPSSAGYKNASDGRDRGTNYYGPTTSTPPPITTLVLAPPTNLRLISSSP